MKQDGIKRASIDRLKSRFETAYYSEDLVITPLVMFRELDDLTALIQGVSIGVTVNGTARIKINGKLHELRPNTLFIFNENTVIEQVKASIRSSGYMITYSQQYLNSIHVDTQDLISIYHGFLDEPCVQIAPEEAAYIHDISKLMRSVLCMEVDPIEISQKNTVALSMDNIEIQEEIESISNVTFSSTSGLDIVVKAQNLDKMKGMEADLETLSITFPKELSVEGADAANRIVISDVDLAQGVTKHVGINAINLPAPVNGKISFDGNIEVEAVANIYLFLLLCTEYMIY